MHVNSITSIAYWGSQSARLLGGRGVNSGFPGSGTTGLPYYSRFWRTLPTQMWDGYLNSNYHSLQGSVKRSFAKGLMVQGAYTFSKSIDLADDDGSVSLAWNWASIFRRNRATAGCDRTHLLHAGLQQPL